MDGFVKSGASLSAQMNVKTETRTTLNSTDGLTCDRCKQGSFYLSSTNLRGCLKCVCMGITNNCSSTSQYKTKENLIPDGWRIGTETSTLNINTTNNTIASGSQSFLSVSATLSNHSRPLLWAAPLELTRRSLVRSYGGSLEFILHFTRPSGESTNLPSQAVIIKGKGLIIYQMFPTIVANVPNRRNVTLKESSWRHQDSDRLVNRSEFLLALAKPQAILISSSPLFRVNGSYDVSLAGLSIATTQVPQTQQGRAWEVESCSCGEGYVGTSCERCAPGYKRGNVAGHQFFGTCVPCDCNGHSNLCDAETGRCLNCQHNTTGDHCQFCTPGFYGNATQGTSSECRRCPCEQPRATTNLCSEDANGTVQCQNCSTGYEGSTCDRCSTGYFGQPLAPGGICQRCNCNNNSNICNTTSGVCLNCQFNTSGDRCERCKDEWYGDALTKSCKACECSIAGSNSSICNHTTGQCPCKPNVSGRNCSSCRVGAYGFNNVTGCTACNCNSIGSLSLQCNQNGTCSCQNLTVRMKCDRCTRGYYGLPIQQCSACNCNTTGSRNESCGIITGQCSCQPGVAGRQCNQCLKQHTNFTSSGCTACPSCTQLLQRKVDLQVSNTVNARTDLQQVQQLAPLNSQLTALERRLNTTQVSKTQFDTRMTTLQAGIARIRSDDLNRSVNSLQNKTTQLTTRSRQLQATANSQINRLNNSKTDAERAAIFILGSNNSVHQVAQRLDELKRQSEMRLANVANMESLFNNSFENEIRITLGNLSDANTTLSQTRNASSVALMQATAMNVTGRTVEMVRLDSLTQQQSYTNLKSQQTSLNMVLANLQQNISEAKDTLQATNITLQNVTALLNVVQNLSNLINSSRMESWIIFQRTIQSLTNSTGLNASLDILAGNITESQNQMLFIRQNVSKASAHAANLSAEANALNRTFDVARSHGSGAVEAVRRYQDISRLINQSMVLSKQANQSLQQALSYLQTSGSRNLTAAALLSITQSDSVLQQARTQEQSSEELRNNLTASNATYHAVHDLALTVDSRHQILLTKSRNLLVTANYGNRPHNIETTSLQVQEIANRVLNESKTAHDTSQRMNGNLTALSQTVGNVNVSSTDGNRIMDESLALAINISRKLLQSPTPESHVSNITHLVQQFNATRSLLDSRLTRLQSKLNAMKQKVAQLQVGLSLNGSNFVSYRSNKTSGSAQFNEIQLDFRTTQRNALLASFRNTLGKSANSISLAVINSRAVLQYNINGQLHILTNWEVGVSDGNWRRVYATRQGSFSRLTVSMITSNYSRTYSLYQTGGNSSTRIPFFTNATLFLGGYPAPYMVNYTVPGFSGCVDNVYLNQEKVQLWNPASYNFKPSVCNSSGSISPSTNTPGASFFGNGFVQLVMGNFSVQNYSKVVLEFRSLQRTGTLFAVHGANQAIVYAIILNGGRVFFTFTPTSTGSSVIRTAASTYADGNWYRVEVTRSTGEASMRVSPINGSNPEIIPTPGPTGLIPEGITIYFGGVNLSRTSSGNTYQHFAGCIRNVMLSNNHSKSSSNITLNNPSLLQGSQSVSFTGCLPTVKSGMRYIGNGYSIIRPGSSTLSTLDIVFKTYEPSGILAYSTKQGMTFYLALYHGNIFLEYKNASRNAKTVLFTRTQTLNDGLYHRIRVVLTRPLISINVDTGRISESTQLASGLGPAIDLNGGVYIGGIGKNISLQGPLPVKQGFKGGIREVKINEQDFTNQLLTTSAQVSLAGVVPQLTEVTPTPLPTTPPPTTPPPSCSAARLPLQLSSNQGWIGFQQGSYLALRSPSEQLHLTFLRLNFLLSITFRAYSPNGVVFFASQGPSNDSQFISFELVNGKLVYKFNAGGGLVHMTTTGDYSQGSWNQVYLLRTGQFGAMLVTKDNNQNSEYQNNRHGNGLSSMDLRFPFYLGGVPGNVRASPLQNARVSLHGCINQFQIQDSSRTFLFNLNSHSDVNVTRNIRQCYQSVEPQVRLRGSGYIIVENSLATSTAFTVTIRLRLTERNGVIWHLVNTTNNRHLILEQRLGQIILSADIGGNQRQIVWTDPSLPVNRASNSSYSLCDNSWHTITVRKVSGNQNGNYTVNVDATTSLNGFLTLESIQGTFYVGGSPSLNRRGTTGCINGLNINNHVKDLTAAAGSLNSRNVNFGCNPNS